MGATTKRERWSVSEAIRKLGPPKDGEPSRIPAIRAEAARIIRAARKRGMERTARIALYAQILLY